MDFDWVKNIECGEYYIIDCNSLSKLSHDEWVLLEVIHYGDVVKYNTLHFNLHPHTEWSYHYFNSSHEISKIYFNELISSNYWKRVYELPEYTLLGHRNNTYLTEESYVYGC